MNITGAQFLSRYGSRNLWRKSNVLLRMNFASGESCPPPPCPCPPPKPEPSPEPPPCQKYPPPCPPPLCPKVPDPANPCNYCPPTCIDPDYPDLTRLKRNQCRFQKDDGLPVFLKGGQLDVILYQGSLITVILGLLYSSYVVLSNF